ncbi:MAG: hypothetical protein L3J46_04880 [Kangiellaceae bacterium]|nr:hypothetical protein [Kangiellaceae bacterium]
MKNVKELEEMLKIFENPESDFDFAVFETVKCPFQITAIEYFTFAEEDLRANSTRAIVNAISNAKRSLDCRVEEVLYAFGLRKIAKKKRWNIPKKLDVISELGTVSPRILNKLNSLRNLLEHEFHKPNREQAEDFVDVVSLFNQSTRTYLFRVRNNGDIAIGLPPISQTPLYFKLK